MYTTFDRSMVKRTFHRSKFIIIYTTIVRCILHLIGLWSKFATIYTVTL